MNGEEALSVGEPVSVPLHGLSRTEMDEACADLGASVYRAAQVWRWLYVQRVSDWADMTNLPAALRGELAARYHLNAAESVRVVEDQTGTRKILVRLRDGERVEEVLIPGGGVAGDSGLSVPRLRRTVCVSSQAGCGFHCAFCASGQAGFFRHLHAGEIVGQVLLAAKVFGDRVTNVVFMGIGEPLDNYDQVLKAIRILNAPDGLAIGARRITISTCGVVPGIERLAGEGLQLELSVSLHAPDDELRSSLMPVNRKYGLEPLLASCGVYANKTGRIVTFEYTLVKGVNDGLDQARKLSRLLAPLPCRVNLIPLSPIDEYPGEPSTSARARVFIHELAKVGINSTTRDSKGSGLKAACGQLRYGRGSDAGNRVE